MQSIRQGEEVEKPSLRLRLAALFFTGLGVLGLLGAAFPLLLILASGGPLRERAWPLWQVTVAIVTFIAMIFAGDGLRKRQRRAGIAALAMFALPLAMMNGGASLGSFVAAAVGLAVIASVWNELRE